MSPELGFVLLLALLWGPTAVWLGYRAVRGPRSRLPGSFVVPADTERSAPLAPDQSAALVAKGFWVCGACRSLNRREAPRCYGCKAAMGSTGQPGPDEQPIRPMVPVMAETVARSSGETEWTPVPVVSPTPVAVPVVALAPAATLAPAPDVSPAPVSAVRMGDPVPVLTPALREAPSGAPVCPFLGFRNDPSTRCDFPDPRNLCHASSARGAGSSASRRRFIPGKAGSVRAQEIGASQQGSLCLTTAHEECARYPAAQVVAAN